jgi:hypothetical protein
MPPEAAEVFKEVSALIDLDLRFPQRLTHLQCE